MRKSKNAYGRYRECRSRYRLSQIIEIRNEAEPVLRAAEKKLPDASRVLSVSEVRIIQEAIEKLKAALVGEDIQRIRDASSYLNQTTIRLAELLIKETLSSTSSSQKNLN